MISKFVLQDIDIIFLMWNIYDIVTDSSCERISWYVYSRYEVPDTM